MLFCEGRCERRSMSSASKLASHPESRRAWLWVVDRQSVNCYLNNSSEQACLVWKDQYRQGGQCQGICQMHSKNGMLGKQRFSAPRGTLTAHRKLAPRRHLQATLELDRLMASQWPYTESPVTQSPQTHESLSSAERLRGSSGEKNACLCHLM